MKRGCVSVVVVLLAASRDARAADPMEDFADTGVARTLLDEGRALMRKGRYDDACAKLETSIRLQDDVGARWSLADCNEHVGKVTSAWEGFLEVAARARTANETERKKNARSRALALEPRIAKLVVEVPASVPRAEGLEVKCDGVAVDALRWGTAIPVDPGTHRVTVRAGTEHWHATVESVEGRMARVEVPAEIVAAVPLDADAPRRMLGWMTAGVAGAAGGVLTALRWLSLETAEDARPAATAASASP